MGHITRRDSISLAAGIAAASTLATAPAHAAIPTADVKPPSQPIEAGATLRVLRPVKYIDPDGALFDSNTKKFSAAMGVPVRVDYVGFEDLRPQTAVAARTGAGPDIVLGWSDDPHLYTDSILDMTELANYLGKKYGGWQTLAALYGKQFKTDKWIAIPFGGSAGPAVYRKSWVKEAGFDTIPSDHGKFLDLCRALKKNGHPPGFALGNAVGDANSYCGWLLWSHNGYMVDEDGKIAINRPETIEALKYAKELYQTFIPRGRPVVAGPEQQQGVHRRGNQPDAKRLLDLLRDQEQPQISRHRRGRRSRADADRPREIAARDGLGDQRHGVQAHQVSERGQGIHPLHDGI